MNRSAVCPSPDDLLRAELGELSVNKSETLRAHADACPACGAARAALRRLTDDLVGPPPPADDTHAFVARVEAAVRAQPRPAARAKPTLTAMTTSAWTTTAWLAWWRGRYAPLLAVAATVVVLLPTALTMRRRSYRGRDVAAPVIGTLAARGRASDATRVGAEVLLVRDGHLQPLDRQPVCGAEAFAVRVTNLSGRALHVMAFARDAAGDVHWLYPGYLDPRTNPTSVAIADGTKDRVLDEIVQPDAPAAGPMQFVTLLSSRLLKVKEVEARLADADPTAAIPGLFPDAIARAWTASCAVRR